MQILSCFQEKYPRISRPIVGEYHGVSAAAWGCHREGVQVRMEFGSWCVHDLRLEEVCWRPREFTHVAMDAPVAIVISELETMYQAMFGDLFDFSVADVAKSLMPDSQGSSRLSVGSLGFG
jgi:hypothetical protein